MTSVLLMKGNANTFDSVLVVSQSGGKKQQQQGYKVYLVYVYVGEQEKMKEKSL